MDEASDRGERSGPERLSDKGGVCNAQRFEKGLETGRDKRWETQQHLMGMDTRRDERWEMQQHEKGMDTRRDERWETQHHAEGMETGSGSGNPDSEDGIGWMVSKLTPRPRSEVAGHRRVRERQSIPVFNRKLQERYRWVDEEGSHDGYRRRQRCTGMGHRKVVDYSTSDSDAEQPRCTKRRRTLEPEAEVYQPQHSKRRRMVCDRSKESETSRILDKFMTIMDKVRSSDRPRFNFNTNVIPDFDPMSKDQTVLTWLTKVEECAEIYGWDDKETIHYSLPKLTGVAKTWYQGLGTLLYTWPEWKKKLLESFPSNEDYAELLTEMLAKRAKYGDSLEHYYYAKINLLNRCKISGKQAVDCLLHGVDERTVKIGAKAAKFTAPEQLLGYFKTVKINVHRDRFDLANSTDRRSTFVHNRTGSPKPFHNDKIQCFNCHEIGHPVAKCNKPIVKCSNCDRNGHLAENCRSIYSRKSNNEKDGKPEQK